MDLIRSGKAPEVILRKGAEGNLPLPVEDKIEILALLATAPEAGLREIALATFQGWNGGELRRIMASPQTSPTVLCFAAQQVLAGREDLRETLLWNPSLPAAFHDLLQPEHASMPAVAGAEAEPPKPPQPEPLAQPPIQEAVREPSGPIEREPNPVLEPISDGR